MFRKIQLLHDVTERAAESRIGVRFLHTGRAGLGRGSVFSGTAIEKGNLRKIESWGLVPLLYSTQIRVPCLHEANCMSLSAVKSQSGSTRVWLAVWFPGVFSTVSQTE